VENIILKLFIVASLSVEMVVIKNLGCAPNLNPKMLKGCRIYLTVCYSFTCYVITGQSEVIFKKTIDCITIVTFSKWGGAVKCQFFLENVLVSSNA
jgi:hypothetical protein